MNKIEKLRKQQEANANKLEKAKNKRWLKWFNGCLKLIKKRIKQAVKNGESLIEVQANDLYRVVPWEISDEFDFNYLAKQIIKKFHEEGFYSFYYPGCAWVSAYVKIGWTKVDKPIQKFINECEYLISLNYTRNIGLRYYLYPLEIIASLKNEDIKEAMDKNIDPETYLKKEYSYLFEEE